MPEILMTLGVLGLLAGVIYLIQRAGASQRPSRPAKTSQSNRDDTALHQSASEPETQNRDTNRLIFDIAEFHRYPDIAEMYPRLKGLDLYVPAINAGAELRIQTTFVKIKLGEYPDVEFMVFYTNLHDQRLGPEAARVSVAQALDIAEKENLAGVLLYNDGISYFGITR